MTDDVPDYRGELSSDAPIANLHTLTLNINAMRRLLERKTEGGEPLRANAALIRSAIEVGREEARQIRTRLEGFRNVSNNSLNISRDKQIMAVAEIDDILDSLEQILQSLSD